MFTRHVIMQLKPDSAAALALIFENEVIPLLRGQKGLRHDDTFISPEISEAVMNSYWDTEGYADAYVRAAYPAVLKALAGVLEGVPQVETFVISSSTFHRLTSYRREAYRTNRLGRGVGTSAPLAHYAKPKPKSQGYGMVNCINERRVGSVTVLDLDGEIRTGGSRIALHDAIGALLGEGRNRILLNLNGLSTIDASGLGELISSHVALHESGGQLRLLHLTRALREMMTMTKILTIFDVHEDEAEALAGFGSQ
ncbi:MAG TPA: STAS domain-containing protein [Pyrinomonadaceae bacterium]